MQAWQLINNFGLDNLQQIQIKKESLKSNEVRVKIQACSLNYRDLMVINGVYNPKQTLPLIPLSDCAGEIIEVGEDVEDFAIGDKVCGTFSQKWDFGFPKETTFKHTLGSPINGVLCEEKVFSSDGVIKFPSYLSYEEASSLPCAALTAFNAMFIQGNLRPGDSILIQGTGGVSIFALLFAKAFGLNSIVTSSSDNKLEKCKSLGATHLINYQKNPSWHKEVLSITENKGVDLVMEVSGAMTINQSIACTKMGGMVAQIGILSGIEKNINLIPILMNNIRLQGIFVGPKNVFCEMNKFMNQFKIRPQVSNIFSFNEAKNAFMYMAESKHFGKICISNN